MTNCGLFGEQGLQQIVSYLTPKLLTFHRRCPSILRIKIQRAVGGDDAQVAALARRDAVYVAFDPAIGVPGRDDMQFCRAPVRYIEIFILAVEYKGDRVGMGLLELLQDSDQVHGAGQGVVMIYPRAFVADHVPAVYKYRHPNPSKSC